MTSDTDQADESDEGALRRTLPIVNRRGLHARASARFVQLAETFDAEITVSRDGLSVGGQSIMGLMMLAAGIGSSIDVAATGPEASAALDAITALVADRFGEEA
ncbi:serine kinase [Aureimonas sp. Leaf454]|uniref:HPr family phosphocarrier protein n=1 Tax=Aureimonas sp. Leaf454 TaxID=1736381 RepID=UPI0006F24BCE|nr:HPr family phosphocarrier protein [Aureimonas sp. Leaf454]KQT43214.1 serine kinase [Aureimonas sp. Leaf454]